MKKIINYIKSLFKSRHKHYVVLGRLHKSKEGDYIDWDLCIDLNLQDTIKDFIDRDFYHILAYEVKDCVYDERFYVTSDEIEDDDVNMTLTEIM